MKESLYREKERQRSCVDWFIAQVVTIKQRWTEVKPRAKGLGVYLGLAHMFLDSTWAIFCFPRFISRKPDQKWISQHFYGC